MSIIDKVRYPEELDNLEKLCVLPVSYSRFNTFGLCSAMYFYNYILKLPSEFGPPAVLGNIVHAVLEDTVGETLVLDEMIDSYKGHRAELDPEQLIGQELIDVGENLLVEFYDRHAGEKFEVIGKELPFKIVIGTALIRGFIDLVIEENGIIKVIDWKTGKREVAAKNAPQDLQLGIYALAMAKMFPGRQIYAELYYLRTQRRKGHLFTEEDLVEVYNKVIDAMDDLLNTNNFLPTSNVRICYFCDYAKPDICKIGAKRVREKRY